MPDALASYKNDYCHSVLTDTTCNTLESYGEAMALLVAILLFLITVWFDWRRKVVEQQEKRRTARYWVFYNASNRINQDRNTLWYFESFSNFGPLTQSDKPQNKDSNAILPRKIPRIIEGFASTWANDDVLNQAMAFEFSLLHEIEKSVILEYFEHYNTLEDRISMISPFLTRRDPLAEPIAERLVSEAFDSNQILDADTSEKFRTSLTKIINRLLELENYDSNEMPQILKEQLNELLKRIKEVITEAISLMEVIWLFDPAISYDQIHIARKKAYKYGIDPDSPWQKDEVKLESRLKKWQSNLPWYAKYKGFRINPWSISRTLGARNTQLEGKIASVREDLKAETASNPTSPTPNIS